jgi:hypothetical protein
MDTLLRGNEETLRSRLEADLAARLARLFQGCPRLWGFTVQEESPLPRSIVCYPAGDLDEAQLLMNAVAQMLFEIVDEEPEAAALLHGRTFARTLH